MRAFDIATLELRNTAGYFRLFFVLFLWFYLVQQLLSASFAAF